ncbi:hypothetical protein [Marinobacter sp. CHS3-4]|uniref:hypothetical protein n=1 Tax=Marinobacter sp. CHS3-4 TaxID=3045174 RepID=UPI0024B57B59|nr:hypothetical protein [Marinobacter sp. CHS3-4]MDI9244427.1 hypothetical protein [Marinobacter sp. CHS3-4]
MKWALNGYLERRGLTKIVGAVKQDDTLRLQFDTIPGQSSHNRNDLKEALVAYVSTPRIDRRLIVTFPDGVEGATQELIAQLNGEDHLKIELEGRGSPQLLRAGYYGDEVFCASEVWITSRLPSFETLNVTQEPLNEHSRTVMKLMGLKQPKPELTYQVAMADGSELPFELADIDFDTRYTGTSYTEHGKTDIYQSYFRVYLGQLNNVEVSRAMFSDPTKDQNYTTSKENFERCDLMAVNLPKKKANFLSAQNRPFSPAGEIRFNE